MDQDTRRILDTIDQNGTITADGALRALVRATPETEPLDVHRGLALLVGAGLLVQSAGETFKTTPLGDAVRANRQRSDYIVTNRRRLNA